MNGQYFVEVSADQLLAVIRLVQAGKVGACNLLSAAHKDVNPIRHHRDSPSGCRLVPFNIRGALMLRHKAKFTSILFVLTLLLAAGRALGGEPPPVVASTNETVRHYHGLGYVVVTPDGPQDGGDFGRFTPGTKTSGIQEALDFARKSRSKTWASPNWAAKNVYIARGYYPTESTITVHWMGECWVLEATGTFINYRGTNGDALVIESQMNNQLHFGYIVAGRLANGAVVHIRPTESFSQAPRGVVTCSQIRFYAIVGSGNVVNRKIKAPRGIGLLLDASSGPILENSIFCDEINACGTSLECRNPPGGSGILCNDIQVLFNHLGNVPLLVGEPGTVSLQDNRFTMYMEGETGARIFGSNNTFDFMGAQSESGPVIIFEGNASGNVVRTTSPLKSVLDESSKPTNHVLGGGALGFGITRPGFPASGASLTNRTDYNIEVAITKSGTVRSWTQTDADNTTVKFDAGLTVGQHFMMAPGDSVTFTYGEAPDWRWKAVQ